MIETPEQARQLVFWSKYPPMGGRSYSGGANTHYAPSGRHEQNMREMNERTLTIVQLETVKGIENAQAIAAVDGVDAIIVGPADLGISMGIPDNPADPRELAMIAKAAQAAKAHGKHFGIIGGNDLLSRFGNADLLISAIDTHLLSKAMKQAAKDYESWCMHE
jgi:2-keto-3-deoxy-L-rhamnonate aldolase RhmA